MITHDILLAKGAKVKIFQKGDFIFKKGNKARFYFQIISGEVKMNNFSETGGEFIQGIFKAGESFGEPPLLINNPYPANAEVTKETKIIQLPRATFIELMKDENISLDFLKTFAQRLYYKSVISTGMSIEKAELRILNLLDYLKKYEIENIPENQSYRFELTRQEIANLTGLRVETVIRTIKKLENKKKIKIINRKLYR